MFVRSGFPFNYDVEKVSDETGLNCGVNPDTGEVTPSLTQQHFAQECDINTIVERFGITGQLPTNVRMPSYGDFEMIPDYHAAMNAIRAADEAFMMMPANVRARFGNDAGAFVEFCSKEENRAEAVKLGLVAEKAAAVVAPGKPSEPVVAGAAGAVESN